MDWLIDRIIGIARLQFFSIRDPVRKAKKKRDLDKLDDETVDHNSIVTTLHSGTAVCYTDGSASPNPGPCGAGASIFFADNDTVIDMGRSLGWGSNNVAELFALGAVLTKLGDLKRDNVFNFEMAHIFSDSKLALLAATSGKKSLVNGPITRAVKIAYAYASSKLAIHLHWIRGHSAIGGNERVDRISKAYASAPNNDAKCSFKGSFQSHALTRKWPFGFPLISVPPKCFTMFLPMPANMSHSPVNDQEVLSEPSDSAECPASGFSDELDEKHSDTVIDPAPQTASNSKKKARSKVSLRTEPVRRSSRVATLKRISVIPAASEL